MTLVSCELEGHDLDVQAWILPSSNGSSERLSSGLSLWRYLKDVRIDKPGVRVVGE